MSFHHFGDQLHEGDARRQHPITERNKYPILAVLQRVFPAEGLVLELASGTGQHAAWFTEHLTGLRWQPTDREAGALASIDAWRRAAPHDRILPAIQLDVQSDPWPVAQVQAMLCVNMLQVSPWSSALGLLAGAARHLDPGAPLVIYSPLSRGGVHTSPGNQAFDQRLRAHDPDLGLRDVDALIEAGAVHGLRHEQTLDMPSNNTLLVLRAPQARA